MLLEPSGLICKAPKPLHVFLSEGALGTIHCGLIVTMFGVREEVQIWIVEELTTYGGPLNDSRTRQISRGATLSAYMNLKN
jgi:hypothetical protein